MKIAEQFIIKSYLPGSGGCGGNGGCGNVPGCGGKGGCGGRGTVADLTLRLAGA